MSLARGQPQCVTLRYIMCLISHASRLFISDESAVRSRIERTLYISRLHSQFMLPSS
jgi:hypothetical protein